MASKVVLVLGVLLFMALLVSTEVAARDLAEETNKEKGSDKEVEDYGNGRGNYGRGGGGGRYDNGGGNYNRGGGGGGDYHRGGGNRGYYPPRRCYHGCCRRGYYGGCYCCSTADEIPEAAYLPEVNN